MFIFWTSRPVLTGLLERTGAYFWLDLSARKRDDVCEVGLVSGFVLKRRMLVFFTAYGMPAAQKKNPHKVVLPLTGGDLVFKERLTGRAEMSSLTDLLSGMTASNLELS